MDDIDRRLDEVRERVDAATPGPWRTDGVGVTASRVSGVAVDELVRANAAFVAGCRDDVPWLLALVAELRGLLSDLCEDSRAAREAVRYRRALEEVESLLGTDWFPPAYVQRRVREALGGKADD